MAFPEALQSVVDKLAKQEDLQMSWKVFENHKGEKKILMKWEKKFISKSSLAPLSGTVKIDKRLVLKYIKDRKPLQEGDRHTQNQVLLESTEEEGPVDSLCQENNVIAEGYPESQLSLNEDPVPSENLQHYVKGSEVDFANLVVLEHQAIQSINVIAISSAAVPLEVAEEMSMVAAAFDFSETDWAKCCDCQFNGFCDSAQHKKQYMEIIRHDARNSGSGIPCQCKVCISGAAHNGCVYREIRRLLNHYLLFDRRNLCFCDQCVPFKYRRLCLREELRLLKKNGDDLYPRLDVGLNAFDETFPNRHFTSMDILDSSSEERRLLIENLRYDIAGAFLKHPEETESFD